MFSVSSVQAVLHVTYCQALSEPGQFDKHYSNMLNCFSVSRCFLGGDWMACGGAISTFPVLLPYFLPVLLPFVLRCPLHHKLLGTTLNTMHMERCRKEAPLFYFSHENWPNWKPSWLSNVHWVALLVPVTFLWEAGGLETENWNCTSQSRTPVKCHSVLCENSLIQDLNLFPWGFERVLHIPLETRDSRTWEVTAGGIHFISYFPPISVMGQFQSQICDLENTYSGQQTACGKCLLSVCLLRI